MSCTVVRGDVVPSAVQCRSCSLSCLVSFCVTHGRLVSYVCRRWSVVSNVVVSVGCELVELLLVLYLSSLVVLCYIASCR